MAEKAMKAKKQELEATAKRLEEAYKLEGKLEIILEIQDKFQNSWGIIHIIPREWDRFTKPLIEQKV